MGKPRNKKYNNNKGKGKGKADKDSCEDRNQSKVYDDAKSKDYANDPKDYIPNPMLLDQVGGFSFNDTIGVPIVLETSPADAVSYDSHPFIGNIMEFSHFPHIGQNSVGGYRSPFNTAMLKIYNIESADNGKNQKYLPEDIGFSILAVGEVISLASNFCRAYGVAFRFNPRNRTVPRQLIKAMGFDSDDMVKHLADYRLRYNAIITKASNIRVLDNVPYLRKCWRLYESVYFDKGSAMGQMYVNRPAGYLKFTEGAYNKETGYFEGSKLTWHEFTNLLTGDAYLTILEQLVDVILSSASFNYVFTDVMRLSMRQGYNLLTFNYLPENYVIDLKFSETYMTQMHNADWGLYDLTGYELTDDVASMSIRNNITPILDLATHPELVALLGDKILDFPFTDNPTPGDIVDALAYKQMGNDYYSDPNHQWYGRVNLHCATDHPVYKVNLHFIQDSNYLDTRITQVTDIGTGTSASQDILGLLRFETFDIKPIQYKYWDSNETKLPFGNLNYFTTVSPEQFKRICEYMFLGIFDVENPSSLRLATEQK